jgi:enoyl-CoA hydratase/carnithine racemase
MNALRVRDKQQITDIIGAVDTGSTRSVIIHGAGERAFCAGSDLKEMAQFDFHSFLQMEKVEAALYEAIIDCPVPVIAAVQGWALGTGCVLAAVCDLSIATHDSTFGQPEVRNGAPTPIHGAILPRIIGFGRARWLVLTGRTINATTAQHWGLVSMVAPDAQVMSKAKDLAAELAAMNPASLSLQKVILRSWLKAPFDAAVDASTFVAASAYVGKWPASAAERMQGRTLRPTEEMSEPPVRE